MHSCKTLVIQCIDFRFQEAIHDHLRERGLLGDCDIISIDGSARSLVNPNSDEEFSFVLRQIKLASALHGIQKIIVIHHRDCGAYGGSRAFENAATEFDRHAHDMKKVREIFHENFPGIHVDLLFSDIDKESRKDSVCFKTVDEGARV